MDLPGLEPATSHVPNEGALRGWTRMGDVAMCGYQPATLKEHAFAMLDAYNVRQISEGGRTT